MKHLNNQEKLEILSKILTKLMNKSLKKMLNKDAYQNQFKFHITSKASEEFIKQYKKRHYYEQQIILPTKKQTLQTPETKRDTNTSTKTS